MAMRFFAMLLSKFFCFELEFTKLTGVLEGLHHKRHKRAQNLLKSNPLGSFSGRKATKDFSSTIWQDAFVGFCPLKIHPFGPPQMHFVLFCVFCGEDPLSLQLNQKALQK
jgi:hypothetical protein